MKKYKYEALLLCPGANIRFRSNNINTLNKKIRKLCNEIMKSLVYPEKIFTEIFENGESIEIGKCYCEEGNIVFENKTK